MSKRFSRPVASSPILSFFLLCCFAPAWMNKLPGIVKFLSPSAWCVCLCSVLADLQNLTEICVSTLLYFFARASYLFQLFIHYFYRYECKCSGVQYMQDICPLLMSVLTCSGLFYAKGYISNHRACISMTEHSLKLGKSIHMDIRIQKKRHRLASVSIRN